MNDNYKHIIYIKKCDYKHIVLRLFFIHILFIENYTFSPLVEWGEFGLATCGLKNGTIPT